MADLATLKAWRDALEQARFAGVHRVEVESMGMVTYASDAEMRTALADLNRRIAIAEGKPMIIPVITSKGL